MTRTRTDLDGGAWHVLLHGLHRRSMPWWLSAAVAIAIAIVVAGHAILNKREVRSAR